MSNVIYSFDGRTGKGALPDGTVFLFDREAFYRICNRNWYRNYNDPNLPLYISDANGIKIYRYLIDCPKGYEVDHINLDTLDNRSRNLRIVTHQQNQMNQPLQKNNTSGVSGVSYYRPRGKYRARIKISQHDIHLGYYRSFLEAVQARNVGMECMFGEFGRYNNVPDAPGWIREKVVDICERFHDLSATERPVFQGSLA